MKSKSTWWSRVTKHLGSAFSIFFPRTKRTKRKSNAPVILSCSSTKSMIEPKKAIKR